MHNEEYVIMCIPIKFFFFFFLCDIVIVFQIYQIMFLKRKVIRWCLKIISDWFILKLEEQKTDNLFFTKLKLETKRNIRAWFAKSPSNCVPASHNMWCQQTWNETDYELGKGLCICKSYSFLMYSINESVIIIRFVIYLQHNGSFYL